MTVSTTESQKSFDGNGAATEFSFTFPFFNKDEIAVVLYDENGAGTVQTLDVDYSIPGVFWPSGGQVDMVVPPAAGETLVVSRIIEAIQSAGFRNLGDFRAEVHEDAFDRIVMMIQQMLNGASGFNRAIRIPNNETPVLETIQLPFDRAGKFLAFDENKHLVATSPEAESAVYLPTVTATAGQTQFFLGFGQQSVQVNINGSIQQTETFTYDPATGYVTLTSPLGGGEKVQLAYSVAFGSEAPSPALTADRFKNVYDMQANASSELEAGDLVSSGLSVWTITETVTAIPLDSGKYAQAHGDLWANDFKNPDETDDGIGLRLMRDHAEELERSITLRSSGGVYALESTETVPEYGGEVGLYLTKLNLVKVDFGWGLIAFRVSTPGLGAIDKDAVLALAPPSGANSYYSYPDIKSIQLSGGNFPTKAERPETVIRGNYRVLAYGLFENIEMSYARRHTWHTDGFVMLMTKVRGRYAGDLGSGFRMETTTGAKTGYLLSGCTVDYAGARGFELRGASGHTYCHFNNCHADFIGRDDDGTTIDDNISFAYAYDFGATRVVNMTACGSEFSTKILKAESARELTVSGLFSLGVGHSDGVTEIDHAIRVAGYFDQSQIKGFDNRSPSSPLTDWLLVDTPSAYNTNSLEIDNSIPKSQIRYGDTGQQTSAGIPLVTTLADVYKSQNRLGAGDIVKTGSKKIGASSNAWYGGSDVLEQTFYALTSATSDTIELLELSGEDGTMGFQVEVTCVRSTVSTTVKYLGYMTITDGVENVAQPAPLVGATSGVAPTLAMTGSAGSRRLRVTMPNTYSGNFIKVTAVQRASANYCRFNWL